jgi:hypothetical protein
MKKKKIKNTFLEGYTIKADYQKDDGFWTSIETTQLVPILHGINEKANHKKAEKLFLKENKHLKNLIVRSVIYQ